MSGSGHVMQAAKGNQHPQSAVRFQNHLKEQDIDSAAFLDMLRTEFFGDTELHWSLMVLRVLGSVVLAGLIGVERETHHRPAGLRTNILVGLAACCYSMTTVELIAWRSDGENTVTLDPIRLIQAVTGGVAFLAAGLIVFSSGKVKGLTTGATLWLAGAIGVAVGLGQWNIALIVTAAGLFVVRILKKAKDPLRSEDD